MTTKSRFTVRRTRVMVLAGGLLSLLLVSTVMAAVPGDPFKLGVTNTINALTILIGSRSGTSGAMLQVDNTSTSDGARAIKATSRNASAGTIWAENTGDGPALSLKVNPGRVPLSVSSGAGKAINLNADKLDGLDSTGFIRNRTYSVSDATTGWCNGGTCLGATYCDAGDVLLSGGFLGLNPDISGSRIITSAPIDYHQGWLVEWKNTSPADEIHIYAYCADHGSAHVSAASQESSPLPLEKLTNP